MKATKNHTNTGLLYKLCRSIYIKQFFSSANARYSLQCRSVCFHDGIGIYFFFCSQSSAHGHARHGVGRVLVAGATHSRFDSVCGIDCTLHFAISKAKIGQWRKGIRICTRRKDNRIIYCHIFALYHLLDDSLFGHFGTFDWQKHRLLLQYQLKSCLCYDHIFKLSILFRFLLHLLLAHLHL